MALGGTSILSEFPELCGVEQELINRCQTEEISDKFIRIMRLYESQAQSVGSGFYMNPSPEISKMASLQMPSNLREQLKGGTSPVTDVLDYTEYVTKPGLNLLCTPGNDVESTSAEVGSGANVVLFTTGLGTPTGYPIAPVVKLATQYQTGHPHERYHRHQYRYYHQRRTNHCRHGRRKSWNMLSDASGEVHTKAEQLNQDDLFREAGVSL